MSKLVSEKQIIANRINAKKGGVKTQEWKEISKMNALTFWAYSPILLDEEEHKRYIVIKLDLSDEYSPQWYSEESLINQIALCEVKLYRISLMEEYFNIIAETEWRCLIAENLLNKESEFWKAFYELTLEFSNTIKVRNLPKIEKMQQYRDMIENRKSKYINELMKIKYFKRNYA